MQRRTMMTRARLRPARPLGSRAMVGPLLAALALAGWTIVLTDGFRHRVLLFGPHRGRILWQYGRTAVAGSGVGHLSTPDGLDPLPAGAVPGT